MFLLQIAFFCTNSCYLLTRNIFFLQTDKCFQMTIYWFFSFATHVVIFKGRQIVCVPTHTCDDTKHKVHDECRNYKSLVFGWFHTMPRIQCPNSKDLKILIDTEIDKPIWLRLDKRTNCDVYNEPNWLFQSSPSNLGGGAINKTPLSICSVRISFCKTTTVRVITRAW